MCMCNVCVLYICMCNVRVLYMCMCNVRVLYMCMLVLVQLVKLVSEYSSNINTYNHPSNGKSCTD